MNREEGEYVLVTEYFHPDTAATGLLMTDLAVGLQNRGLDMTVYTGQPNYHSGENERQPRVSDYEGVSVRRIRAPLVRQSSLLRRLYNWTIFTIWMSIALLFSRHSRSRELIFVSNPPFLPVAVWFICKIRRWEYTYIVHDLYPDQPVELGHIREGGIIDRLWSRLNANAFRDAKHVVALGPEMKARIRRQAGPEMDPEKIEIIHNWADDEFIQPLEKSDNPFAEEHGLVEPFVVLYSGNIGEFHNLEPLVHAAAAFQENDVVFLIIGEGDAKADIVHLAEENDLSDDTVRFLPYQPMDELPYSLTAGDVSVVAVREGFEGICVSSKIYTSMAAGMPILCIAQPDSDEARLVDEFDAGVSVAQGEVAAVEEAIQNWVDDADRKRSQGTNAREAFEDHFTKGQSIDQYYELLSE